VAFYLDPVICQSSHIDCAVEFTDEFGLAGTGVMKTRAVDVVCPLFYTPETINVAMLKRLLSEVRFKDSRVFRIAAGSPLKEAFDKVKRSVLLHDVKMVREFVEEEPFIGEAWFYGKVADGAEEIVMKTTIRADMMTLEVFVGCNNLAGLTGLLAEMGNKVQTMTFGKGDLEPSTDAELRKRLEAKGNLLDKHVGAEARPQDDSLD